MLIKAVRFAIGFSIIDALVLIIVNHGGRDPLTGITSPHGKHTLILSSYRLGASNTFLELYQNETKMVNDIAEFPNI